MSDEERETIIRKDCLDKKAHICTTDRVECAKLASYRAPASEAQRAAAAANAARMLAARDAPDGEGD